MTMTEPSSGSVAEAIVLARAGNLSTAYQMLRSLTAADPNNAEAWLWLGGVTGDPVEQHVALERVLRLDPANPRARRGLQDLRDRHPELFSSEPAPDSPVAPIKPAGISATAPASNLPQTVEPLPPEPAPVAAFAPAAQADALSESLDQPETPEQPRSSLDDELTCPYCGSLTDADDMCCPHCQGDLAVAAEPTGGARLSRLVLALLWLSSTVAAVAGSVWTIGAAQDLQGGTGRMLVPVLQMLGLSTRPDMLFQGAMSVGLTVAGLALIGLIIAVGLLLRWRAVYVIHLLVVLAALSGAIVLLVISLPVLGSTIPLDMGAVDESLAIIVGALVLTIFQLLLTFASRREFFPRHERARLPRRSRSAKQHFRLGTHYRDQGWRWAAARELEQAVEQEPEKLKYRRALADVYASMGDHFRARDELRASLNLQAGTSSVGRAGMLFEEVQRGRQ
jgi:tetratricopeptide (TPR) repeat protein